MLHTYYLTQVRGEKEATLVTQRGQSIVTKYVFVYSQGFESVADTAVLVNPSLLVLQYLFSSLSFSIFTSSCVSLSLSLSAFLCHFLYKALDFN